MSGHAWPLTHRLDQNIYIRLCCSQKMVRRQEGRDNSVYPLTSTYHECSPQERSSGTLPKWKFPTPETWHTKLVDLSSRRSTKTDRPQRQMESTCASGKSSRTENGKSWLTSIIRIVSQWSSPTFQATATRRMARCSSRSNGRLPAETPLTASKLMVCRRLVLWLVSGAGVENPVWELASQGLPAWS